MTAPGSIPHLAKRFFGAIGARPLCPQDQAFASAALTPPERRLFFAQPPDDQRHAVDAARLVARGAPGRPDLIAAALLHDVAKRHAELGIFGRSLASACALVKIPVRGRWAAYLAHGEAGAIELAEAGSLPLAITFARRHHGRRRPATIDPVDWALLRSADDA